MAETRLITLRRPDDWHVHLRDGDVLAAVAPLTAPRFARAVVIPNLVPPVATTRHGMPARRALPCPPLEAVASVLASATSRTGGEPHMVTFVHCAAASRDTMFQGIGGPDVPVTPRGRAVRRSIGRNFRQPRPKVVFSNWWLLGSPMVGSFEGCCVLFVLAALHLI